MQGDVAEVPFVGERHKLVLSKPNSCPVNSLHSGVTRRDMAIGYPSVVVSATSSRRFPYGASATC